MLRVQIEGQRVDDPGPNLMTQSIEYASGRIPGVLAYHVNASSLEGHRESGVLLPTDCIIYTRSTDATLADTVDRCNERNNPLIVMSTGIDLSALEGLTTTGLIAPNTSLDVIRFVRECIQAPKNDVCSIFIEEHHQEEKADKSGTALLLADRLGLDEEAITSVRNRGVSRETFGSKIPQTGAYAGHIIRFCTGDDVVEQRVLEVGRLSYATGALALARKLANEQHSSGSVTHVVDIDELPEDEQIPNPRKTQSDFCFCGKFH